MMFLVLFTCMLAGCLAQQPHPCASPPLLTGAFSVSTQNQKLLTYAKYMYDALGQRLRVRELIAYGNQTTFYDALLIYREAVMYKINERNRTCEKVPLKLHFLPLGIPKDASLLNQVVLGSSSNPGEGLLVNTWYGDLPNKGGKFVSTVTEFGCIPINTMYHTDEFGWAVTSFFNNVIGISDPTQLNPPSFCLDAHGTAGREEDAEDFYSLFLNKH